MGCKRAGYLQSDSGYWNLTPEGEKALSLPKGQLVRSANESYRSWRSSMPSPDAPEPQEAQDERPSVEPEAAERLTLYQEAVETAGTEIETHILKLGPYEYQDLVAELLLAMGYYVPLVAQPGPDGGVDVVAYKDPLGMSAPRLKVQVKHRERKVDAKDVRELEGVLRKEGDIGLIVSSSGFTTEAVREIRSSNKHIETLDLDRLVALWQENYPRISEAGRRLLPLAIVHFLAPKEEAGR
jgi:restriction system protein